MTLLYVEKIWGVDDRDCDLCGEELLTVDEEFMVMHGAFNTVYSCPRCTDVIRAFLQQEAQKNETSGSDG